jgi:RHS repeat-associated protein
LAGNILEIVERVPGCGVAANPEASLIADPELRALVAQGNALARRFTYDPLYRLISATGRECTGGAQPQPWADAPRCGFNSPGHGTPNQDNAPNLTSVYGETYSYDPVGNMTRLRHITAGGSSVRQFSLLPGTNRLRALTAGATDFAYTHDPDGNMTSETTSRHFEWDHSEQMKVFRTQVGTAEPSVHAHYLYDAARQRVKKLVRKQGGSVAVTTYIDGTFEHHRWHGNGAAAGANNHLHVMDDQQRIALLRVGTPHPNDKGPAVQYHLGDHLGTSSLAVNHDGGFINREEHTPYGETSFGSFARKRYRFTGKERDEESGLSYHRVQYYAPWLGRWTSCDPAGLVDGPNLFAYVRGNPLTLLDHSGTQAGPWQGYVRGRQLESAAREVRTSPAGRVAEWTGRFTLGIAARTQQTIEGTYQMLRHPVRTGEALAEAARHPIRTAETVLHGIQKTVAAAASGDPDAAAAVVFEVGSLLIPASKASKAGKLGKIERVAAAETGFFADVFDQALVRTGSYETVRGHHVHQAASYGPGAARTTNPNYNAAVTIAHGPGFTRVQHRMADAVQRNLNRAVRGETVNKPQVGNVSIRSVGEGQSFATPSSWLEDVKAFYSLRAAGQGQQNALDLVNRSSRQLEAAGAVPVRVPTR